MHADHADFGPVVASLSLGASWPMRFRRRNTRPYARDGLPGDEVATLPRRSVLARGRSLYVRLAGPGTPGKFTDAATGEHGDLLDIIRHRTGAPTLRAALDEARAFLALEPAPDPVPGAAPAPGEGGAYDATEAARRLWRRCRAIDGTHAERYLQARGLARCRFAALRFHPELRYREGSSVRRLPALVAAVTGDAGERPGHGAILGVQRTWLDPRSPAKAGVASPRKALGRKEPSEDIIVLRDTTSAQTIVASSDEDLYNTAVA